MGARVSVALLLASVLLVGGPAARAEDETREPAAQASNAFALDLYGRLRRGEGNLFLSPWSVHEALSMAAEGAAGETAAEMRRVLRLADARPDARARLEEVVRPPRVEVFEGEERREVPAYEIHLANAIWGQEDLSFAPAFLDRLASGYGTALERVDFRQQAAARARIDAWVAEHTKGRIKDLFPEGMPRPETRLLLANAIYFKAAWQHPFHDPTEDGVFHVAPERTVQVPFLRQAQQFLYARDAEVQVLAMPYLGGAAQMILVLPRAKDGLEAVEAGMDVERLARWTSSLARAKVAVALPRFTFTSDAELASTLAEMGMPSALRPQSADFSRMSDAERLHLGAVFHKAFVSVDEQGTEAAAATGAAMEVLSAEDPVPFVADHPFLFLIVHRPTGLVLFMGRLLDPTAR